MGTHRTTSYTRRTAGIPGMALAASLGWLLLPLAGGCTVDYAVKTTLYADGSVARWFAQPGESLPAAAADPRLWGGTLRYEQGREGRAGTTTKPVRPRAFADSRFPSVAAIPDHLVVPGFPADDEDPPSADRQPGDPPPATRPTASATRPAVDRNLLSRLVRSPDRTDHVFVTADVWRETLTEVVDPEGMRQARADLIYLAARFLPAAVDGMAGDGCDTTRLGDWVRGEGRALAAELVDAAALHATASQHRARFAVGDGGEDPRRAFEASVMRTLATHGLTLSDADGRWLDSKVQSEQTKAFVVDLLARTVTRKGTGAPADRATAARWEAALELLMPGSGGRGAATEPDVAELVAKGADAVRRSAEPLGGPEAVLARAMDGAVRVVGVYGVRYPYTHQFDFSLVLPPGALITRTDGEIEEDNATVRWRFTGGQAWPAGYDMTCHYLLPAVDVQQKLLGGRPLTGRKAVREYLDLLSRDADAVAQVASKTPDAAPPLRRPLREVLEACRADGSMAPLRAHRAAVAAAGETGAFQRARCDDLFALLKIAP